MKLARDPRVLCAQRQMVVHDDCSSAVRVCAPQIDGIVTEMDLQVVEEGLYFGLIRQRGGTGWPCVVKRPVYSRVVKPCSCGVSSCRLSMPRWPAQVRAHRSDACRRVARRNNVSSLNPAPSFASNCLTLQLDTDFVHLSPSPDV